jgi:hypothetical protein
VVGKRRREMKEKFEIRAKETRNITSKVRRVGREKVEGKRRYRNGGSGEGRRGSEGGRNREIGKQEKEKGDGMGENMLREKGGGRYVRKEPD